jgi:hypothetical protein
VTELYTWDVYGNPPYGPNHPVEQAALERWYLSIPSEWSIFMTYWHEPLSRAPISHVRRVTRRKTLGHR